MTPIRRLLLAGLTLLVLAGCTRQPPSRFPGADATHAAASSSPSPLPSPSRSPSGEPQTFEAARAAADRVNAAGRAADGGALWDSLTNSGKAVIKRADYVAIVAGCPALFAEGTITSVALNASNTVATVAESDSSGDYTWSLIYEDGSWRHQPTAGALGWMSLTPAAALKVLKHDGAC
jgi:hypothetical protein